jgi:hypothetical protein
VFTFAYFDQDELEQEIERLKEKVERQKKTSKGSIETPHHRDRALSLTSATSEVEQSVCEICERPGHDIFTCDLLKEDTRTASTTQSAADIFCEDCEGHGHTAENCPYSLDVF